MKTINLIYKIILISYRAESWRESLTVIIIFEKTLLWDIIDRIKNKNEKNIDNAKCNVKQ